MNSENKTSYRVVCLDTDETYAVFSGDSTDRRLAMAMAFRLSQMDAGARFAVIEETVIHVAQAKEMIARFEGQPEQSGTA
jgi:hypothetical protein